MSFRRNVIANYGSQIYAAVIGVLMVPLYVKYMGAEAYGLVGFFVMLQSSFQLLDIGLTPTMARETARLAARSGSELRALLRAMEGIFVGLGAAGAMLIGSGAHAIATRWLNVQHLPIAQVELSIQLMGGVIALRWVAGLYRGTVNGFEHQSWLSACNVLVATARFVLVVPFFFLWGATPVDFFAFQLLVAAAECGALLLKTYRLLPAVDPRSVGPSWLNWRPLQGVWRFSLGIAFSTTVWILVRQTDRIVLSKLLPLSDYAYYTLAVVVAGALTVVSGPVGTALVPRMTRLSEEGNQVRLQEVYLLATQIVAVTAFAATASLVLFAEELLFAWIGDRVAAQKAAPILRLYAAGNGILALAAFPYYLQVAKGDLRLHSYGTAVFFLVAAPGLSLGAYLGGGAGAGYAWLLTNLAYFLGWVPLVHRRFYSGLHQRWLVNAIGPIVLAGGAAAAVGYLVLSQVHLRQRPALATSIAVFFFVVMLLSTLGVERVRSKLGATLRRAG